MKPYPASVGLLRFGAVSATHGHGRTAFQELLEQLQPQLTHGSDLLAEFLQLVEIADALHRIGQRIDVDVVRFRDVGQTEEPPCLFRRAFNLDIDLHHGLPFGIVHLGWHMAMAKSIARA